MQEVFHRTSVEFGLPWKEPFFSNTADAALAIGQDVKTHRQQFLKELRTPSAAIEDDGRTPARSKQSAGLFKKGSQHPSHGGVSISGHDKKWVSFLIIDPVIGGRRNRQAGPGVVAFRNRVFAMVGTNMTIDVEEPKQTAALGDTVTGQLAAELLTGLTGCEPRQFAPQRLDFQ